MKFYWFFALITNLGA